MDNKIATADVNVKEIVDNAMVNLIIDFPTYAHLITRIGIQLEKESMHPALAWVDSQCRCIHINEKMVKEFNTNPIVEDKETGEQINRYVTQANMQFIICHELLHLIGLTFERQSNVGLYIEDYEHSAETRRGFELWNKATDYEINSLLHNNETIDSRFGDRKKHPIGEMPDWVLYESRFKNMNAEEIYGILKEEDKQNQKTGTNTMGMNASGDGDNGDGSNGKNYTSGNEGKGGIQLDAHIPVKGNLSDDARNEMLQKMAEVFGSRMNGKSTGESSIDRSLETAFKPQPFNWRKALSKYMRKFIKENYTWNKPSRAGIANNIILPSQGQGVMLNIGVAIDTSGSITEKEINAMMNHLFTILQQFKNFQIDIWACGSKVYEETLLKITNSNKRDLLKFVAKSDGGNDMRENFKFIRNHYKGKEKIDVLLICSDFYDPLDGDTETTSPCPVIYMCIDHKDFVKPTKINGVVYPFEVDNENK